MQDKKHVLLKIFISTLYLSAFTFGGGYVIVTLMKKKFVDEYHWIDEDEKMCIRDSDTTLIGFPSMYFFIYHVFCIYLSFSCLFHQAGIYLCLALLISSSAITLIAIQIPVSYTHLVESVKLFL